MAMEAKAINLLREHDLIPSPSHMYRLYFKGLVSEETTELLAGFGVAICDLDDKLLFQMKGAIHEPAITVLEAELIALTRGLTEVVRLGINHISIYCDHDQIFELLLGRSVPEQGNIALLMDNVQPIRQKLKSSIPVLVTGNQTKFAYKLAMETIVSETSTDMPATCPICFDGNFEADHMFSVALCGHQFCVECVKRHIEVRLLEGEVPRCLHYQCESKLTLVSCANLLTPKVREMWERMIEEESIPVVDRVYCPNPRCSALMSKTGDGAMRCCSKCGEPFCVNCKVPWHSNLSCHDYQRLGPNPTEDDIKLIALSNQKLWRQCGKCQQMIQLSYGCIRVTCRCGYIFCYTCGDEWKKGGCPHRQKMLEDHACYTCSLMFLILIWVLLRIWFFQK
ncbi:E3 ubiquitin-protein ligase RSL1 [Cardamine amara subsp. amara]|uniref:RBR-type E3 ubiquitin transferase n=1 Tax=Cardamine amara subsp. amara TaxID=228776 RepID=A0ABD1A922_CARAN